jgi:hypothetical protein
MDLNRRGFLAGLGSLLAAPAIVHAGNLMPVRALSVEAPLIPSGTYVRILLMPGYGDGRIGTVLGPVDDAVAANWIVNGNSVYVPNISQAGWR